MQPTDLLGSKWLPRVWQCFAFDPSPERSYSSVRRWMRRSLLQFVLYLVCRHANSHNGSPAPGLCKGAFPPIYSIYNHLGITSCRSGEESCRRQSKSTVLFVPLESSAETIALLIYQLAKVVLRGTEIASCKQHDAAALLDLSNPAPPSPAALQFSSQWYNVYAPRSPC
jgi:hypothetical protein